MKKIEINSYLDSFLLVDRIFEITKKRIVGTAKLTNDYYLIIESLAQLSALHMRTMLNFEKHVFLLKIISMEINQVNYPNSSCEIISNIFSASNRTFHYYAEMHKNNELLAQGELLIGSVDYSQQFNKNTITEHYKKIITCLQKD